MDILTHWLRRHNQRVCAIRSQAYRLQYLALRVCAVACELCVSVCLLCSVPSVATRVVAKIYRPFIFSVKAFAFCAVYLAVCVVCFYVFQEIVLYSLWCMEGESGKNVRMLCAKWRARAYTSHPLDRN